jgi:hypothetical protein
MGIVTALLIFLNGQPATEQASSTEQVHILLGGFPTVPPPVHN